MPFAIAFDLCQVQLSFTIQSPLGGIDISLSIPRNAAENKSFIGLPRWRGKNRSAPLREPVPGADFALLNQKKQFLQNRLSILRN